MHYHAACHNNQSTCKLTITNPVDTYINIAHTDKNHGETCEQKTPRDFQMFCMRLPKRCEDRMCAIYEQEQGIMV